MLVYIFLCNYLLPISLLSFQGCRSCFKQIIYIFFYGPVETDFGFLLKAIIKWKAVLFALINEAP